MTWRAVLALIGVGFVVTFAALMVSGATLARIDAYAKPSIAKCDTTIPHVEVSK